MKKIIFAITLNLVTLVCLGQQATMNSFNDLGLLKESKEDLTAELKKTSYKQYNSLKFDKASISNVKDNALLRYNMYRDEMEFIKSNKIYFLKKKIGSKINFINIDKTYGVFSIKNKPNYFKIINQGNRVSLLVKESVKLIKAKPAKTSYDTSKPAKFDRENDEYFLSFDNENTVEIPRRKKDFYNLFKSDSGKIKTYMKKNKLNHKKLNDLKKVSSFYNTL